MSMKIQATIPFTLRNDDTGELTSIGDGQIVEVTDTLGAQLISDGLAVAFTLITPTGTKTITENGTDIDVTTYAKANVSVAEPTGTISITENGEDIDVKQYAKANVAVPNPSTGKVEITGTAEVDVTNYAAAQVVDANLIAENIKKDVTILGVTGTYEA